MEKPPKKISSLGFFALISILFNLTFCHQGIYSAVDKGVKENISGFELVVQTERHAGFQALNHAAFGRVGEKTPTAAHTPWPNNQTGPPSLSCCLVIGSIPDKSPDCPTGHIISILQKKNCWHQSSDDEPLPRFSS